VGVVPEDLPVLASARFGLICIDNKIRWSAINERVGYLPSDTFGMKEYLRPEGKPAPPLPRRPDFLISSMIQS